MRVEKVVIRLIEELYENLEREGCVHRDVRAVRWRESALVVSNE